MILLGLVDPMPPSIGWHALLGTVAVLGALTLATYLPEREDSASTSPCSMLAGVWVVIAAAALAGPAEPASGLMSLAAVTFGLVQRVRGAAACG